MAIISIDLGSSDRTIDDSNANDGDTVRITSLGSNTLTVDGVNVTISELANVQLGSQATFSAINGANLTFAGGLGDISALNSITYQIGDSSRIEVNGSLLNANISQQSIDFTGAEDGRFTYDPAGLGLGIGDATFDVTGLEPGDQLAVDGRDNLNFSFDEDSGVATLRSGSLLGQDVTYRFSIEPQRAELISNNTGSFIQNGVFTYPALTMVCFARGTEIMTRRGARKIEDLVVGDKVLTADRGFRPIVWHGVTRRYVTGNLRPIRIRAGTLGNTRDLVVSPQHKILMSTELTLGMFDDTHMLVPAKHLLGRKGITQDPDGQVEYHHLLFDTHEIIYSEGIPTESFHPGETGMLAFDGDTRSEILELFPELRETAFLSNLSAARSVARRHEAELIADSMTRIAG